jgi:hypothetical protein
MSVVRAIWTVLTGTRSGWIKGQVPEAEDPIDCEIFGAVDDLVMLQRTIRVRNVLDIGVSVLWGRGSGTY